MRNRWMMVATVTAVVAVVATTGCSGEDLAERVIENRIEQEAGGDVDIDFDDGDLSIKTEDGEFSIDVDEDGDGNVSISGESEDGEFSIESEGGDTVIKSEEGTIIGSTSGDLPDGFPDSVPVPEGFEIQASQSMSTAEGTSYILSGTIDESPSDVADQLIADLESSGYEQVQSTTTPEGAFVIYDDGEYVVSGVIAPEGADGSASNLSMTVTPSAAT